MQFLRRFPDSIVIQEVPASFTFPFDYSPHPLALAASIAVMKDLQKIPPEIHDFNATGKMLGVLVVKDPKGLIGYLTAFSGKLHCGNHYAYFVPPLFDMLDEEGFYRKGEEALNELNRQIKALENDSELSCLKINYNRNLQELEHELEEAKEVFRTGKANRKSIRKTLAGAGKMIELAAVKVVHEKESHHQQFIIKTLKAAIKDLELQKATTLLPFQNKLNELKEQRKAKSNTLQRMLFEQYNFLNAKGEIKNVLELFNDELPPAGTGDCAGPKLLQFAYQNDLSPLCMAEFWWGASPPREIRKQGHYYPACKRKCEPVLGFMLQGLNVEENPRSKMVVDTQLETIYEDEYMLVINKPSEMLSAPGKIDVPNVYDIIRQKYPEATGPLLVHRLDQSTSGILLIAKDKETHAALQRQFEERTVQKRYEAILDGEITEVSGKIELPLRVDLDNRPRQLVCLDHGKPAETYFKVVSSEQGKTRIHFFPVTGRTHQLRVHAAHQQGLNAPILGDDLYGARNTRLHLHAAQLKIIHPKFGEEMTFKSIVPF